MSLSSALIPRLGAVTVASITALTLLLLLASGSEDPLAQRQQPASIPVTRTPPPPPEPVTTQAESAAAATPTRTPRFTAPPTSAAPSLNLPAVELGRELELSGDLGAWQAGRPGLPAMAPPPAVADSATPALRLTGGELLQRYYPRPARSRGIEGRTRLRLVVGTDGSVSEIEILHSEPPGVFDNAAERAARQLRYQPAQKNGQPVRTTVVEEFAWRLR